VVINPTGIFGPVLGDDYASSLRLVKGLLDGTVPGAPRLSFGVVDVRDVAELHLRAMVHPAAAGERFLAVGRDGVSVHEMALILRRELGDAARRVPKRRLPDPVVRLSARFSPELRAFVPELGKVKRIDGTKARETFGWTPIPVERTIADTGRSLLALDAAI
jgi:nucleoside-diphosphate-sugar epimerase